MKKTQWSLNKQTLLGALKQLSLLAMFLVIGVMVWFVWMIWGASVAPFDNPYLSNAEYQVLIEQENQLINIGLWVSMLYVASLVTFFAARIAKVFRAQG
ncbi:hypothetical protein [Vibrio fortis]|uniref:hypothetical protein n=1 Tax=Vibrio fortis TaxID=212667 RepID=UPI001CDA16A7|nr:hypothetical protein [Vibrio fortis]